MQMTETKTKWEKPQMECLSLSEPNGISEDFVDNIHETSTGNTTDVVGGIIWAPKYLSFTHRMNIQFKCHFSIITLTTTITSV